MWSVQVKSSSQQPRIKATCPIRTGQAAEDLRRLVAIRGLSAMAESLADYIEAVQCSAVQSRKSILLPFS
jgi:hypothetical protein